MASLQVKNVPAGLHAQVRRYARADRRTIRDFILDVVRREIARREFRERLSRRKPVKLARSAARTLEDVRRERERDLAR